jgi:hypothetical protein
MRGVPADLVKAAPEDPTQARISLTSLRSALDAFGLTWAGLCRVPPDRAVAPSSIAR